MYVYFKRLIWIDIIFKFDCVFFTHIKSVKLQSCFKRKTFPNLLMYYYMLLGQESHNYAYN